MRVSAIAIWLCLGAATAVEAQGNQGNQGNQGCNGNCQGIRGAPAPVIGSGIPAVLVVGGVLLGATLLKRWRRS